MKQRSFLLLLIFFLLFAGASCVTSRVSNYSEPEVHQLLEPIDDPLEGFNRSMHVLNSNLEQHVASPAVQAWRFFVPSFIRTGLSNFKDNLGFPLRVINHTLQGEWGYAWIDIQRFVVNSTIGILGFWDPATKMGLPSIPGTFKDTLAYWGVPAGCYLNLPLLGPGTVRDAVGALLDLPFNIISWTFPAGAATATNGVLNLNDHLENDPVLHQLFLTQYNSYEMAKIMTTLASRTRHERFVIDRSRKDYNADESFGYLMLKNREEGFYYEARTRIARLSDGTRVPYNCWPLKDAKGIAIILPGLGNHRRSDGVSALAELFRKRGFAAVAISSSFTPDYIENIPNCPPPGYFPRDTQRMGLILAAAVADFRNHYQPETPEKCLIIGYSLGGINTLHLAAQEKDGAIPGGLVIDRYLAINPPPDVVGALTRIDGYYDIPKKWPEAERVQRIKSLSRRLAAAFQPSVLNPPEATLPMTREESEFLIGVNMRLQLASALQCLEAANPTGLLKEDPDSFFHRNNLFAETLSISFQDYMRKVVLPWYQKHGNTGLTEEELIHQSSLTSLSEPLRNNPKVLVFENRNDLLINDADCRWFQEVFGPRATIFDNGGHLGSMANLQYQQALMRAIID